MMRALLLCAALAVAPGCGPGEPGPAGPAGPQGPQGKPGPSINDVATYLCFGFAETTDTGWGFHLKHAIWHFPDDSVMTTCEVTGSAFVSSSFTMYPSHDSGAPVAGCLVSRDVDSASNGYWAFMADEARDVTTATYKDPSSPHHGRRFTFSCTRY